MKDYLEAIQAELEAVAEIKYVDEDWGQLDDYSPAFPVKWPCCLIDLQGATFTDIGMNRAAVPQNRQEADATIVLSIANLRLTNSSAKAPAAQKEQAWLIHTIIQKVHEKMQGFRPVATSGVLLRRSVRKIRRDDGVQQFHVYYTVGMHDV